MEIKQHALQQSRVQEEITGEIRKYLGTNENQNTYQNLWDAVKAVLKEKCIAVDAYIEKEERSQTNHIILQIKKLEKQNKTKPKAGRRK